MHHGVLLAERLQYNSFRRSAEGAQVATCAAPVEYRGAAIMKLQHLKSDALRAVIMKVWERNQGQWPQVVMDKLAARVGLGG